jgi:5,10-methylenetetrahydromethanopterin reductase
MLDYVVRRMSTYLLFPQMFDAICDANGWDKAIALRIRAAMAKFDGPHRAGLAGDENTTRDIEKLQRLRDLYPRHWIMEGNAVGSAEECASSLSERFAAGADGVLLHGSPAADLAPLVDAWRGRRCARGMPRVVNPGRMV